MAQVVLFHHSLGLTPGGVDFAEELRGAGHTVHAPDLYDGQTFETLEEGMGHAPEAGKHSRMERAVHAPSSLGRGARSERDGHPVLER